MKQAQLDVLDFHRLIGAYIGRCPSLPPRGVPEQRVALLLEELRELSEAGTRGCLADIAKELCDVIYTAIGIANMYGIDLAPVWYAVHASNMAKGKQPHRCDGKVPKPSGWVKPDVASILSGQAPLTETETGG